MGLEDDKIFAAFKNQNLSFSDPVNNGVINAAATSTTGLTPEVAAQAFAAVEQYDIPVANIIVNAQQQRDLRLWTNRNYDPVTQRELLKTGYLGKEIAESKHCSMRETLNSPSLRDQRKNVMVETIRREVTAELAYLIGVYLGDGFCKREKVFGVRAKDLDFVEAVRDAYLKLHSTNAKIQIQQPTAKYPKCIYTFEVQNPAFCKWLIEFMERKEILPKLATPELQRLMVEGLFDSEGWCDFRDAGKGSCSFTLGFVTTSSWVFEFKALCESLGLRTRKPYVTTTDSGKPLVRLTFNMASAMESGLRFRIARKQAVLDRYRNRIPFTPQRLYAVSLDKAKIKSDLHGDMQEVVKTSVCEQTKCLQT